MTNQKDNPVKNTYNNVIPAALGTTAYVRRTDVAVSSTHTVVAWASVNGGPMEALIDVNGTGELTPVSELRQTTEDLFIDTPDED
ncbi:hypothetical protein [Gordonia phthalatica]|uniref:Uncharacterized protein n=1 Tax=Gordonia phthalatica TaxID=1136941 RepID=A0A0N7FUL4_9ACTN|nr:hypothetical protein [Gordonia phthalatica]ALG84687.1 hypothetical protein ACH46_09525 [Gordonia phthalatica]